MPDRIEEPTNILDRLAHLDNELYRLEHDMNNRFQDSQIRTAANAGLIHENTELTKEIGVRVTEVYDVLTSFKGAMKVLGWLGWVAKWVFYIGAAVGAVVGAIKGVNSLDK